MPSTVSTPHTKFQLNCANLIALKFGTQKGDVMAQLGTKFGENTINTRKVIGDYS